MNSPHQVLQKPIVVLSAAARTTTATSSSFRVPPNIRGITFISDQNTVTGTSPTMDISIEISIDDSVWFGVARFAQQTAASERFLTLQFTGNPGLSQTHSTNLLGAEGAEVAATGGASVPLIISAPPFMRVVATVGGTNPSFNGAVYAYHAGV